jgi:ATP-dependent exoDNAse (exonuclease V) beta subunit
MNELADVGELGETSSWPEDYLTRSLDHIARFVEEATRLETVSGRDYDGLEAELRSLARHRSWGYRGAQRTLFRPFSRREVLARRDHAKVSLDAFIAASEADLAPLLHESLQEAIANYESEKAKVGCLDFLDLLIKARNLVRDNADVRRDLQNRFTHLFVDEFQDTDPLQAEILLLLSADDPTHTNWHTIRPAPGKLFVVGDPKQSIYRFRRADLAFYRDVKERLLSAGAEELHLATSFRAPPSIQLFVNTAFSPAMTADEEGREAGYVALKESRSEVTGQPTIIALPAPTPYESYGKISDRRINESLPDAIAAFTGWLVNESAWSVQENARTVPIQPRHIAILFRRFRSGRADVTRPYVRALEDRRIPHVLVGGRSFHDREEIIALRNAITAIEWPDDELKVFATLRGPFFALSDEVLLAFRQYIDKDGSLKIRRLNPTRVVDRSLIEPLGVEVADALELLRNLHIGRNHRPIAQTISMLLESVRAHAGIALWRNGEQALANCQRLIDMARQFERTASSFRAFVEKVDSESEGGGKDEAPIVEEGTEGVRIMTVYKAKGLEFPVVILADPTYPATRTAPSRHVDPARSLWVEQLCYSSPIELREAADLEMRRDRAEAIRIAYVATTRARDLLVLPVCGDQPIEGWFEVLNPNLYPAQGGCRNSILAPGCPALGEDSVLSRPRDLARPSTSVRPGFHEPRSGTASVVWWNPSVLALEVDELAPVRHQRILQIDSDGVAARASEQGYAAWKAEREALLTRAARPSVSVQTVTSFARTRTASIHASAENALVHDSPIVVETLDRSDLDRPGGRRFGTLVHRILASIDLNAGADQIWTAATVNGRLVAASPEEIEAAIPTVRAVLGHQVLRRAAASAQRGALRREAPVMFRLDDGGLLEGVVDLAFQEETPGFTGWTVVDFKTSSEFKTSAQQYVAQINLYAQAIAAVTRSSTRGMLLII